MIMMMAMAMMMLLLMMMTILMMMMMMMIIMMMMMMVIMKKTIAVYQNLLYGEMDLCQNTEGDLGKSRIYFNKRIILVYITFTHMHGVYIYIWGVSVISPVQACGSEKVSDRNRGQGRQTWLRLHLSRVPEGWLLPLEHSPSHGKHVIINIKHYNTI